MPTPAGIKKAGGSTTSPGVVASHYVLGMPVADPPAAGARLGPRHHFTPTIAGEEWWAQEDLNL